MIPIDLITGFLGSGKTTFIRQYAAHLIEEGRHICILENDYGAINVDTLLLREALGDRCDVEMVVGGGDPDCHRRRFKTKLIEMGMLGYDRVIVEPSGVFDTDEFFDLLYEEPLDRWYEAGSVISIVDAGLPEKLDPASEYLLASEAANAGLIVPSRVQLSKADPIPGLAAHLNRALAGVECSRRVTKDDFLAKDWKSFDADDWKRVEECGHVQADHVKLPVDKDGSYENLFYFKVQMTPEKLKETAEQLFAHPDMYGNAIRVKGFVRKCLRAPEEEQMTVPSAASGQYGSENGQTGRTIWYELNATRDSADLHQTDLGQEVVIVIGEHLNKEAVGKLFGETRSVTDYSI